jgi:hypothetical protein
MTKNSDFFSIEWVIFVPNEEFFSSIMARRSYIQWDDNHFYSASTMKQQLAGKHFTTFGHIILILSQPVSVIPFTRLMVKQ